MINWAETPASQYPALKGLEKLKKRWRKGNYSESIFYDRKKKLYYHKDPLHGEIEVYDKRGCHKGVILPTGEVHPFKGQVPSRTIKGLI
ncbi:colicin E3/pyocin S6 family cytotoxin [Alkaliphilus transvaalensis]|uniref:colicin E3/pyocin S6 family cytotoxin n=1 Tax=Alkaliphilus transvaalensis TaxID=114628 RepID=UPI0005552FA0|nr:colicin E3/pyocin S6 family cytotoxin [Alkaliphilus transvaalensis]